MILLHRSAFLDTACHVAMADSQSNIVSYRIVHPGCAWWQNKKANQSRNKVYCRQYEIVLTFADGKQFKDVMTHAAKGQGRDCYFLHECDLCLKLYPELDYTTNAREAAGSWKFQPHAPLHLPKVIGQNRQQVDTHSQGLLESDTLLVQKVGDTLSTRLTEVATKTCDLALQQELVQWLLDIAIMTEKLTQANLQWNEDFHSGNIAWSEKTRTWYIIDLEQWANTTETCQRQWSVAGKRLLRDLRCHTSEAGVFFCRVVTDWLHGTQVCSEVLRQRIIGMSLQGGPAGSNQTPPPHHYSMSAGTDPTPTANHPEARDSVATPLQARSGQAPALPSSIVTSDARWERRRSRRENQPDQAADTGPIVPSSATDFVSLILVSGVCI